MADDQTSYVDSLFAPAPARSEERRPPVAGEPAPAPAAASPDADPRGYIDQLFGITAEEREAHKAPPNIPLPQRRFRDPLYGYFGADKEPGVPELPSMGQGPDTISGSLEGRLAFGATDAAKLSLLLKAYPDLPHRTDRWGNVIVTMQAPGDEAVQEYYLNKPGPSLRDLKEAVPTAAMGILGGVGGAAAARLLPFVGRTGAARVAGTGLGTGVAEGAQEIAAGDAPDLDRVKDATLTGGIFEALSRPARMLYGMTVKQPRYYDAAAGKLTPEGYAVLHAYGLGKDEITDDFARAFGEQAKKAANPQDAARFAEARSLPTPVDMTKGQISLSPSDQMFESLAEKGAYGKQAEEAMTRQVETQRNQLERNVPGIQSRIAGDNPQITTPHEGAADAQAELVRRRTALKGATDEAYDAARDAPAALWWRDAQGLAFGMRNALADFHSSSAPAAHAIVDSFEDLTKKVPGEIPATAAKPGGPSAILDANGRPMQRPEVPAARGSPEPDRDVLFSEFESRRRQLSALARSNNPTERAAAIQGLKRYDDVIDGAVDAELLRGDPEAVKFWKEARAKRKELGDRFEGKDLIQALTEKEEGTALRRLKVEPEQAANFILGKEQLVLNKPHFVDNLRRLKAELGPESEEWNKIRQAAWLKLAQATEGAQTPKGAQFTAARFASAVDKNMRDSPAAMRTLFEPEEIALIQQFKRQALRVGVKVRGGDNYSNTTPAAANLAQRIAGAAFASERAGARLMALPIMKFAYTQGMGMKAGLSRAAGPARAKMPAGMTGGAAAGSGAPEEVGPLLDDAANLGLRAIP